MLIQDGLPRFHAAQKTRFHVGSQYEVEADGKYVMGWS